jgi:hypothetical protein
MQASGWRRRARWRWVGYAAVGALAVAAAAGLVGFGAGYRVERPGPEVVYRHRHPSGPLELVPVLPPPYTPTADAPLRDKRVGWMDGWLNRLQDGVNFKTAFQLKNATDAQKQAHTYHSFRAAEGKTGFDRSYRTFSAALNTKNDYRLVWACVFLKRGDRSDATYAPVYRQMVANVDYRTKPDVPPAHSVVFDEPSHGEKVFVVAVIENKTPGQPIVDVPNLLTLEVE